MQRPVQRMLHKIGRDLNPDRWIFVLGCYNSATTLLASILEKHPLIGGLPNEGAFLTDALPYPELFGWPRMWSQCAEKMLLGDEFTGPERAKRIKRQWSLWFPKGAPNLVEKSIANVTRIDFLQKYFTPAYFIYIIRNGYVVSKGIQKKANYARWGSSYKDRGYPIELCAEQWKISDEVIEKKSKNINNIKCIKYEDLTSNPIKILNEITEFLDVAQLPTDILKNKWTIHDMNSSIVNMNPSGLKRLSAADFDAIDTVAGKVLKKYGYSRDA